jgi:hypothetical protein
VNRPSSALGLLLGFLALTMFAVSSTNRSTTVKPASPFADRAALRRQAAFSRLCDLAAAAETTDGRDVWDEMALCIPGSIDSPTYDKTVDDNQELKFLRGPGTSRLAPVQIEAARDDHSSAQLALTDSPTYYDAAYDQAVFGIGIAGTKMPLGAQLDDEGDRELSAADVATVFHAVLKERPSSSRNATNKPQRRASLEGVPSLSSGLIRAL